MRASCGYREAGAYRRFTEVVGPVLAQRCVDSVREEAADALARFLRYDAFDLRQADGETRELVPVVARGPRAAAVLERGHGVYGAGLSGWVASRQEALLTNRAHLDPRSLLIPGTPRIPEAVIGVPLLARGRLNHVLSVRRFGGLDTFSEQELVLTRCFGDLVGIALDNANARAELQRQASTDALTGLSNRRHFMEQLANATAAAQALDQMLGVLLVDVDGLKLANDTLGHHVGDRLLSIVADTLRPELADGDVAARLAGDEFAALLPGTDAVRASAIACRLEQALNTAARETTGLRGVGASVGWAAHPTDGHDPEELLLAADRSMYETKRRHHRFARRPVVP